MNNDIYKEPYDDLVDTPIDPFTSFGSNVRLGFGVIIEKNCRIGNNTMIGHYCVLRQGTIIGENCKIGHHTVFEGECSIEDRVVIEAQCHITKRIVIEEDVFIGPSCVTSNTNRIVHGRNYSLEIKAPIIRKASRIGAGARLKPGVEIGENALVGIGSVVTKNVPAREVWYGNPAKLSTKVSEEEIL